MLYAINTNQPMVSAFLLDCLEYWAKENTLWSHRNEPMPQTMRDVVRFIQQDEADHIVNNHLKATAF